MSRLCAVLLAASTLIPLRAIAQAAEAKPASPAAPSLAPAPAAAPSGAPVDPATRDLVRREVERAKEEMRDEVRAEIQGAQSAREFMETSAAGDRPKLEFLQLNGYLRVRGDLMDNFDLRRAADPDGYFLFPRPLRDPDHRGTLTSGNMRFRLEPTLNVSEQIRVMSQIDILDNLVLGSTPVGSFARSDSVLYPFQSTSQVPPTAGLNSDRNSMVAKRAWAEVQTPVGLLSFGRMPSSWGLGVLSHAGAGIDDDLGDSVDRLQFALTPISTPVGRLVLVPMYEIVATGVTSQDFRVSSGLGQPFDRDMADDAKAIGLKIVRADSDDEVKRKLERGEGALAFGAWYMYKTQAYEFPQWLAAGAVPAGGTPVGGVTTPPSTGSTNPTANDPVTGSSVKRDAYAHTLDLWTKYQTKKFRFELELAGIYGQIGNAAQDASGNGVGPVLLRQFGGAAQAAWTLGKFTLGGEAGMASGDRNPGFGNRPGRGCYTSSTSSTLTTTCLQPQAGDVDGMQFAPGDKVQDIRNFRFNPAYHVDLILWRDILQGVTDAFYLKPTLRYEFIEGLAATLSVIYSQAIYASSTPSSTSTPLGLEVDSGLNYKSDDGFLAWLNVGMLQPLSGLGYGAAGAPIGAPQGDLSRAWAIRSGVAVKF
ncbi:TIGR04551 family protein [Anaeromyxobacter diazotrophicus]|uniref:TIGR04551 family protein n=1 Tax=Anaeromyxobacter diazotrophicus TaxID=2590199 RepID=A0A7I9VSG7_9BACT|nr:TIGR04551 family protein [Anaeromyxobacter diazotrophicus]GEJ59355.1 hypothetical protein AMYX_40960 [Anaeromyxobacter diazotrophicus]